MDSKLNNCVLPWGLNRYVKHCFYEKIGFEFQTSDFQIKLQNTTISKAGDYQYSIMEV